MYTPYTPYTRQPREGRQMDRYVAMIPGGDWVAVLTDSAIAPKPVLAFKMTADGEVIGIGSDMQDLTEEELFSYYTRRVR